MKNILLEEVTIFYFQMLVRDAIIFNGRTASPACFPSFLVC